MTQNFDCPARRGRENERGQTEMRNDKYACAFALAAVFAAAAAFAQDAAVAATNAVEAVAESAGVAADAAAEAPKEITALDQWATYIKQGGKTMYFVVNQSETAKEVASAHEFTLMAPLSGMIIKTDKAKILPNHSLFLIGDGFEVREAALAKDADKCGVALRGPWEVTPITGGPVMPPPHTLSVAEGHESLEGWQTWDDAFSGTMLYKTEFIKYNKVQKYFEQVIL